MKQRWQKQNFRPLKDSKTEDVQVIQQQALTDKVKGRAALSRISPLNAPQKW